MSEVNIKELVDFFGSQKDMAERMGISESAISLFINKLGFPAFRAVQIEIITDGKFKAVDLVQGNKFYYPEIEDDE